jgi:hypothetical protein
MSCKGLGFGDWPKKQQALTKIAANQGRKNTRHDILK